MLIAVAASADRSGMSNFSRLACRFKSGVGKPATKHDCYPWLRLWPSPSERSVRANKASADAFDSDHEDAKLFSSYLHNAIDQNDA